MAQFRHVFSYLVVCLAVLVVFTLASTSHASGECGVPTFSKQYYQLDGLFYWGEPEVAQGTGCNGGNIHQTDSATYMSGQWMRNDSQTWQWSELGVIYVPAGTHNPTITVVAGPVEVDTPMRVGGRIYGGMAIWWF